MKVFIRNFLAVIVAVIAFGAYADAQQVSSETIHTVDNGNVPARRRRLIEWNPEVKEGQRYTIAIRPLYLANDGLRLDFEYELKDPGSWLQFDIIGHYRPKQKGYSDYYGYSRDTYKSWASFASGFYDYTSLSGISGGVAYKDMMGGRGAYWSAAFQFNYFNVDYYGTRYVSFVEDGMQLVRTEYGQITNRYYKPEISFNIGHHFNFSRNVFGDAFFGLGYSMSFCENFNDFDNYGAFGYSGLYFNLGLRLGVMWKK